MLITLFDTSAAEIRAGLDEAHREVGQASGLVFTLLVKNDGMPEDEIMSACITAGREHPSRIILVLTDSPASAPRLDAELHLGEDVPGEIIVLRFHGKAEEHADSVLIPLLVSDSPVIAYWPATAPSDPAADPIGALASRRITDAKGAIDPGAALRDRIAHHTPGDTDLAWTRATPWRALLAAALDQCPTTVTGVRLEGECDNPTIRLLAAWCESRLPVPVNIADTDGPGITSISLSTEIGEIVIAREDGLMARLSLPTLPSRSVALRRPVGVTGLITEELRRMDEDVTYAQTLKVLGTRYLRCDHAREGRP